MGREGEGREGRGGREGSWRESGRGDLPLSNFFMELLLVLRYRHEYCLFLIINFNSVGQAPFTGLDTKVYCGSALSMVVP